jgi:MraZ protein
LPIDIFGCLLYNGSTKVGKSGSKWFKTPRGIHKKGGADMLFGKFEHSIDAKNRIFIPAKHREKLGSSFIITLNVDKCLSVYSFEDWQKYSEKLDALPNTQSRNIIRFIYSNAVEVQPDGQGRVVIPNDLKNYAGIEKDAVINGAGDHAEIWSKERWTALNDTLDLAALTEQMIELGL